MHPQASTQDERDALDTAASPRVGLSSCLPLLDTLPDATILVDTEGRIAHANPRATALFLLDLEHVRGESIDILLPRLPWHETTERPDSDIGIVNEFIGLRGDQTEFFAEIVLSPVTLHEGHYVLANLRDITARKHAERQTERHAAELEEFAEAVTHDLKAPLTGIVWLLKEALATIDGSEWRHDDRFEAEDLLTQAGQSAKQMAHLIDGLLDMARFGSDAAGEASADPREIVDEVLSTLGPSAHQRNVHIEVGDIAANPVPIAAAHLRQVLHNLLSNAIRHVPSDTGHIQIALSEQHGFHGERVAWLIADDNGPGISATERERIFRAFQRGNDPASKRENGLGLGLSLVRKVASLYGGRTWVDRSPLGGARFIVEIPISVPIGGARFGLAPVHDTMYAERPSARAAEMS